MIDDLIVAGAGFAFGYLAHGISTGDWGAKAVLSGGIGALTAWIGLNTCGASIVAAGIQNATWNYVASMALNTAASLMCPALTIPVSDKFSISVAPGFGVGSGGTFTGTFNATGTYTDGDFSVSYGFGEGENYSTKFAGITYYDRANDQYFSYYATHFTGQHKQTVGGIGYKKGDFSVRWENDFFTKSGDKYRTNAIEFGVGDFVFGTNLWTNDPAGENSPIDLDEKNLRGKKSKNGAWEKGQVLSSPLYVGYKNGNTVTRVGFSHPRVQDRTQNFIHKNFPPGYTHFFNKYDNMQRGEWSYSGYYNPYSLY